MTKDEFVSAVAEAANLKKTQAKAAVDAIFGTQDGVIVNALSSGDSVVLTGFGVFETKNTPARSARNPATGKTIQLPAGRKSVFRMGKGLKEAGKQ